LFNRRTRIVLIIAIWLAAVGLLALWFTGNQPRGLVLAAGPADSETFSLGTALATALNDNARNFTIEVFETGGTADNIRLLLSGQVDIATAQADAALPEGLAGIARLYPDAYHLIVRADTDIQGFADLRGHRIAIPPTSSAQYGSFWFLSQHYGLKETDFTALPMAEAAANFAMIQGQVDAVFRVRAPGNPVIRELIGDHAMRLVAINQADALALKQPSIAPGRIPVGSYRGEPALPLRDEPTAVVDRLLIARADLDRELAYQLTRGLFDERSSIVSINRLAGLLAPLADDPSSVLPAHPGARRYFDREKPGFIQQNARLASAVLYTVVIVFSGLFALRGQWQRARRLRMGDFNHRLLEIADQARRQTSRQPLIDIKYQLVDILTEVIRELDSNRVSQAEFEHFSFTWQSVDALVRDQLAAVELADLQPGDRMVAV
jgi:TRAP transporter TAXI family solute receptor